MDGKVLVDLKIIKDEAKYQGITLTEIGNRCGYSASFLSGEPRIRMVRVSVERQICEILRRPQGYFTPEQPKESGEPEKPEAKITLDEVYEEQVKLRIKLQELLDFLKETRGVNDNEL